MTIIYPVVPTSFFTTKTSKVNEIKMPHSNEFCEENLEYHCIKRNKNCRVIFDFLATNGIFSISANLQKLFEDTIKKFPNKYADSLEELMDRYVFPTFESKFTQKLSINNGTYSVHEIEDIKGKNCFELQGHLIVTLKRLGLVLKKFYNKFHVINNKFDPVKSNSIYGWDRYYGTLMTNLNYDLESPNVISTLRSKQMRKDMISLMNDIIPSTNLPITDVIGLLGYNNKFESKNPEDDELNGCSYSQDSYNTSCEKIEEIYNFNTFHGMMSPGDKERFCNLKIYANHWNQFMRRVDKLNGETSLLLDSYKFILLSIDSTVSYYFQCSTCDFFLDKNVFNASNSNEYARNPCGKSKKDLSQEMRECCKFFEDLFNTKNIEKIMLMTKFSIDFSKPWISQYYHRLNPNETGNLATSSETRDLEKIWMAEIGRDHLGVKSEKGGNFFPNVFG